MPPTTQSAVVMVNVDGKPVPWDMAKEQNPATVGNNKSRIGFIHNPYVSAMGRFFQNTIKHGMWSIIHRIHDKEIPRYEKTCYKYDDPRLKNLETILKKSIMKHVDDNDRDRKQKLASDVTDIVLFLCKEDVFYRARLLMILKDLAADVQAHPELYELDTFEQYNYDRFQMENYLQNKPILTMTHAQYLEAKQKGEI